MGRKKKRRRRPKPPSEPLTDAESGAIIYLANKYLSELEGEALEPWKQTFRLHSATPEMKRTAVELERNLADASRRGPGRPPKPPREGRYIPNSLEVVLAVRDFIIQHPGAMVQTGERLRYSDEFKVFAVSLLAEDGLAQDMTVEEAASFMGMPYHTLAQWCSGATLRTRKQEHPDE